MFMYYEVFYYDEIFLLERVAKALLIVVRNMYTICCQFSSEC